MRKIALACMALLITTAAESREMPAMSVAPNSDVLLAQSQNMDFNSSQHAQTVKKTTAHVLPA